jgi:hypothetical protein
LDAGKLFCFQRLNCELQVSFLVPIFRCLTITATENTERSKGTITSQDSSGIAGVGDGLTVVIEALILGTASGLGAVKKGTKFTVPKVKSYLKS